MQSRTTKLSFSFKIFIELLDTHKKLQKLHDNQKYSSKDWTKSFKKACYCPLLIGKNEYSIKDHTI